MAGLGEIKRGKADVVAETPSLALCKAIEKLIDEDGK